MTARLRLSLRGSMDHLRIVWLLGETLLDSIEFPEDPEGTRYNVLLAVQEMLTNVLRHGYDGQDLPIEVELQAEEDAFSVCLRDQGPPFDPLAFESEIADPDEAPREGGYGILITRMVMDGLDYERDGDWNVLTMRKFAVPQSTPRGA